MAIAYTCDHCKDTFPGKPSIVVRGDNNPDTWLHVSVFQSGKGKEASPDLCPECRMAAIRGVLKDMGAI